MAEVKDARGLLCPEPVLITKKEMDLPGNSTFQVLVDSEAAKNNITRLADKMKWQVSAERNGEEYLLTLIKK